MTPKMMVSKMYRLSNVASSYSVHFHHPQRVGHDVRNARSSKFMGISIGMRGTPPTVDGRNPANQLR